MGTAADWLLRFLICPRPELHLVMGGAAACRKAGIRGSFLPPPPDDPLPDGQVKGTLRVSLRDRCATPDLPVRSQDWQLSRVREEDGAGAAGSGRATA